MKRTVEHRLKQVAEALILASFTNKLGLLDGKTGIAIFFYHYARYLKNDDYEEYAGILIDEIYQDITKLPPFAFSNGLTGIGWDIKTKMEAFSLVS